MPIPDRALLQTARRAHAVMPQPTFPPAYLIASLTRLSEAYRTVQHARWRLDKCHTRGWKHAAKCILDDLHYALMDMRLILSEMPALLPIKPQTVGLRQVYEEFEQLDQEFGTLVFEADECNLAVTTEPITLDGVYLGPFEIQLKLRALNSPDRLSALRVIAR